MMSDFDVFLSYKSDDNDWVAKVAAGLKERGVRVWVDKEQIRPGDLFVDALEAGLESSSAVALVVTEASMSSGWVKEEYNRALRLAVDQKLQLIPIIKGLAKVPGFLGSRNHIDFRDPEAFEQKLDSVIWPGLTGKRLCCGVSADAKSGGGAWHLLLGIAESEGIDFGELEDIHGAGFFLERHLADRKTRWVVVIDPFEGRPSRKGHVRNSVQEYIDFLLAWRNRTRDGREEIVFVLFHETGAWKRVREASVVTAEVRKRLEHYFFLPHAKAGERQAIRRMWNDVQKEALRGEIVRSTG